MTRLKHVGIMNVWREKRMEKYIGKIMNEITSQMK